MSSSRSPRVLVPSILFPSIFAISTCVPASLLVAGSSLGAAAPPAGESLPPVAPPVESPAPPVEPPAQTAPVVELAICLDVSGSMDGLLDGARARLWSLVSDLATATPTPSLKVALLTFGCDAYDPTAGWTRIDAPFTDDLDLVSERLFALSTNGGTELVGRVVALAARELAWTPGEGVVRMIVVAGNESANQDQEVPYPSACREAIERAILVNSIFCGSPGDPIAAEWADVARRADGQFVAIDQSREVVDPSTPMDEELAGLSASINETYLACGEQGAMRWQNQSAQDANALRLGSGAAASRASAKASALYDNRGWDLVDGCAAGTLDLATIPDADLPEEMRGKTLDEKRAIVEAKGKERAEIRSRIESLQKSRAEFIAAARRAAADSGATSLDDALRQAIRTQATRAGLSWSKGGS